MKEWKAKLLSSRFLNTGAIGKLKEKIYVNFISDRIESQTDEYRAEILRDFYDVFEKSKWILAFGSFLRYSRDRTMDGQDIDILIRYKDYEPCKLELQRRGYRLSGEFFNARGEITEHKLKYKQAEIDIFFVFEEEGKLFYSGTYENPKCKDKIIRKVDGNKRIVTGEGYCSYIKELDDMDNQEYEFNGMKFMGYKNVDAQLTSEYGDWKTPDLHYDYLAHTESMQIKIMPNAKVIYYFKAPLDRY